MEDPTIKKQNKGIKCSSVFIEKPRPAYTWGIWLYVLKGLAFSPPAFIFIFLNFHTIRNYMQM